MATATQVIKTVCALTGRSMLLMKKPLQIADVSRGITFIKKLLKKFLNVSFFL
jgi:hypothetical protein